jgi:amino acid transporter
MKKVKQILAIIGVILLVSLYLTTLILAIFGNPNTMNLFFASIVATVVIPVLFWAYSMIYRLLKNHYSQRKDISGSSPSCSNEDGRNHAKTN